jgi:hypothetical protein
MPDPVAGTPFRTKGPTCDRCPRSTYYSPGYGGGGLTGFSIQSGTKQARRPPWIKDRIAATLGESPLQVEPGAGILRTILERGLQSDPGLVDVGRRTAAAPAVTADTGDENAADQDGSGDQHRAAGDNADATGEGGIGAAGDVGVATSRMVSALTASRRRGTARSPHPPRAAPGRARRRGPWCDRH